MLATFSGRNASQSERELQDFVAFMVDRGCSSYLEIGARHGDTFHHVCLALSPGSKCIAVDLPGASWGVATSVKSLMRVRDDLVARGRQADVVVGDSHHPDVVARVRSVAPFDFVLIDADHSYDAVAQDFHDYSPMAQYVAFHDIVGDTQSTTRGGRVVPVEVPRLWAELKPRFQHWEFVADGSQMGIGVIKIN